MMKRLILRAASAASLLAITLASGVQAQDANLPFQIKVDGKGVAG